MVNKKLRRSKVWFDKELIQLRRKKENLYKKYMHKIRYSNSKIWNFRKQTNFIIVQNFFICFRQLREIQIKVKYRKIE